MKRKIKWKLLGAVVTILGAGLTLVTNAIEDRKMEDTIEEKVDEALARREKENEEES